MEQKAPEYWKNLSLNNIIYLDSEGKECEEQWKCIDGYNSRYEVSNLGRVKNVQSNRFMHIRVNDIKGYLITYLTKESKTKKWYVHILVAKHFIPNPINKKTVNHIFGNKNDNRHWMLEWNTYSENHNHAYKMLGRIHSLKGKHGYQSKLSKEVLCINNGFKYGSISDAAKELNLSFQNISKVCKGERNHTKNYKFKFC